MTRLLLTRVLPEGVIQVRVLYDNIQWYQADAKGTLILMQNGPELYVAETPEQLDRMIENE
jgi:hypothetical protein